MLRSTVTPQRTSVSGNTFRLSLREYRHSVTLTKQTQLPLDELLLAESLERVDLSVRATVTDSESRTTRAQWVCSVAQNSAI